MRLSNMAGYGLFYPLVLLLSTRALAQFDGYDFDSEIFENNYKYNEGSHHQHHGLERDHHHDFDTDFHAHPKYAFDYSVKDPHTGDHKEHWETRDGDKVKGSYTLTETDGTKRVVEYEADDKNGFNAVVHKIGTPHEAPAGHEKPFNGEKLFEPLQFHRDYQNNNFQDGFVPVAGNFE